MTEAKQRDRKLVVNRHLWVSGLVDEKWIGTNFIEDFVECDGVDVEPLSKHVVELVVVLVGCENEGQ